MTSVRLWLQTHWSAIMATALVVAKSGTLSKLASSIIMALAVVSGVAH